MMTQNLNKPKKGVIAVIARMRTNDFRNMNPFERAWLLKRAQVKKLEMDDPGLKEYRWDDPAKLEGEKRKYAILWRQAKDDMPFIVELEPVEDRWDTYAECAKKETGKYDGALVGQDTPNRRIEIREALRARDFYCAGMLAPDTLAYGEIAPVEMAEKEPVKKTGLMAVMDTMNWRDIENNKAKFPGEYYLIYRASHKKRENGGPNRLTTVLQTYVKYRYYKLSDRRIRERLNEYRGLAEKEMVSPPGDKRMAAINVIKMALKHDDFLVAAWLAEGIDLQPEEIANWKREMRCGNRG